MTPLRSTSAVDSMSMEEVMSTPLVALDDGELCDLLARCEAALVYFERAGVLRQFGIRGRVPELIGARMACINAELAMRGATR